LFCIRVVERTPAGFHMKIALVHNFYRCFGGEDAMVNDLKALLQDHGHQVSCFFRDSNELNGISGQLKALFAGIYNPFAVRAFKRFLVLEKPDLIHIHNLFPLISPAILPVCRKMGIPVVMTVHNYRLICPCGLFYTAGHICEECSRHGEWSCFAHNCMGNRAQSAAYALRNWVARRSSWYHDNVNRFLALTQFQRGKLIENHFAPERIAVLPNMVKPPAMPLLSGGEYVAFAGRLSPEKGIALLLEAASRLPDIPFRLAGAGAEAFMSLAPSNVTFTGPLARNQMADFYRHCRFSVMPSVWYETFGLTMVEALSWGKPVIASRIAGFPEIIADGVNGLLFHPGNVDDLTEKIKKLFADSDSCDKFSTNAAAAYRADFTPECHYQRLFAIYQDVLAEKQRL